MYTIAYDHKPLYSHDFCAHHVCRFCGLLTIMSLLCQLYLHCKKLTILSAKNVDRKKAEENKKEINETATTSRAHMQASMAVWKT